MKFTDQMGNIIQLETFPKRIISLVPSLTELLFDIGLDEEVVGITQHCILPKEKVIHRARIGGIKRFDFKMIDHLKPDLLIGNKEENYRDGIVQLQKKYPVWMSDIYTIEDALEMIINVGELVDRSSNARQMAGEIEVGLKTLPVFPPIKAAFLIWNNPCMVAAGNTFIHEMLHQCGFVNIFEKSNRYPVIDANDLSEAEVILLSSDPYVFSNEEIRVFRERFPSKKVMPVDGMMFSWYGSHLKYAPEYFVELRKTL